MSCGGHRARGSLGRGLALGRDPQTSAVSLGMVTGQGLWELERARLKGKVSSAFRAESIQGKARLCEVGNLQMCNFQGSLNYKNWFFLEFPF